MGNPKFPRKKYTTPLHPWKEDRIKTERELIKKYGLKNHKEVWKAKTYLGKHRQQARELLGKMSAKDPQIKKESDQLLLHLTRIGILPTGSSLDDVLALETESVLSRRLQTLVYLKGLSTTPDHSRQLINHGHIAISDRKVTIPSYMVIKDEENDIGYTKISPLNELSHPARPKTDVFKSIATPVDEKKSIEPKKQIEPKEKIDVKDEKVKEKEDVKQPVEKTEDKKEEKIKVEDSKKPDESSEVKKQEKIEESEKTEQVLDKKEEDKKDAEEPVEQENNKEKPIDKEGGK